MQEREREREREEDLRVCVFVFAAAHSLLLLLPATSTTTTTAILERFWNSVPVLYCVSVRLLRPTALSPPVLWNALIQDRCVQVVEIAHEPHL